MATKRAAPKKETLQQKKRRKANHRRHREDMNKLFNVKAIGK
jgi:hypothetical protein